MRRALAIPSGSDNRDTVGLGYMSEPIEDVSRANLMRELMSSVDMPGRTMNGVTSVKVQVASGEAGLEGALWRRMVVNGEEVLEHIYVNPASGKVQRARAMMHECAVKRGTKAALAAGFGSRDLCWREILS